MFTVICIDKIVERNHKIEVLIANAANSEIFARVLFSLFVKIKYSCNGEITLTSRQMLVLILKT